MGVVLILTSERTRMAAPPPPPALYGGCLHLLAVPGRPADLPSYHRRR